MPVELGGRQSSIVSRSDMRDDEQVSIVSEEMDRCPLPQSWAGLSEVVKPGSVPKCELRHHQRVWCLWGVHICQQIESGLILENPW